MRLKEKLTRNVINEFVAIDAQGRTVFFPWRGMGKAYVLPDEAKRQQVRRFLTWFYFVPLLYVFGGAFTTGTSPYLVVISVALLCYTIGCRFLVRGLEVAQEPASFLEHCTAYIQVTRLSLLVFGFVVCFLLTWGSTWLLSRGDLVTGIFGMVLFGVLANFYGYLILLKVRSAKGDR